MSSQLSSPTNRLLIGLAVTLAAVAVFSLYALWQIDGLQELQTRTIDRNRKNSLQLLRIQNNLHSLGLAMRDMLDPDESYPLEAWKGQFNRARQDLEDALRLEEQFAPIGRTPELQQYISNSMAQFWTSVDQLFQLAPRDDARARELIHTTLQAQQSALVTTIARLLVENNEAEEQALEQIQRIYAGVERQIYYFIGAVLITIVFTSLYLIRSNRRVFQSLAVLSEHRSELARKLISVQEEVLHSISRELHDEFGQILTAIGAMLRRAEKRLPPESPFRSDLQEVREVTQDTLEKVRSLSQVLHPNILDDGGLEKAIDWYLPIFERQTGIKVRYDKHGASPVISHRVAVHVYRVLQEALNNLARHSESPLAWVRVRFHPDRLHLEVEDRGVGLPTGNGSAPVRHGTGMVAMRERAELLNGTIEFLRTGEKGTLVRLQVPLQEAVNNED